jgi:uncharacterized protein (TIGR00266 family)
MQIQITDGPANSIARITLAENESCVAEGGAMVAMHGQLAVTTSTHTRGQAGGMLRGIKRMLTGESFFMNQFTATAAGASVWFAPTFFGDLIELDLTGRRIIAEAGSFVVGSASTEMTVGWQGFRSLFSGESLFWLQLAGGGPVVLGAFGAIYAVDVDGEYIVDTGHIVAFEDTLQFSIYKAGQSWVTSFLGGEGLVCRFRGTGKVWCQSHQPASFGHALSSLLTPR